MVLVSALLLLQAAAPPQAPPAPPRRTDLNLLGRTNTAAGESRRNENVTFNLIDNNALKELNLRMGTTATIVEEFRSDRNYFGSEYGNRPPATLHVPVARVPALHGSFYESHNNSLFSARSFFQVGAVQPARENDYGFDLGAPLWRGAAFQADGSQQKIRGSVNGNVLVPLPSERAPLTTDPTLRRVVQRFLDAYPRQAPNRPDINPRALNTNAPQSINTDNSGFRLDQTRNGRDRFTLRYLFTGQVVDAFQLVGGQNPDTMTKAHTGRLTWSRTWSAETITDVSVGFDRLASLLVPEPNNPGPGVSFGGVLTELGPSSSIPIDRVQNLFRYAAQIRQTRGAHSFSAGAELNRRQINGTEASSHRGTLQFRNDWGRDALTNFRLGLPTRFSAAVGNVTRGFRNTELQFHAGDSWRARPSLTLHYGVRFQPVPAPDEVNRLSVLPYTCDCNNFAPRFGFAWRLPRWGGVLRGAYGLHYGEIFTPTFQQVRFNPPGNLKLEIHTPNLADPLGSLTPADLDPGARSTIFDISPGLVAPYSQQYNITWEPFQLSNWKLQLGYVGSRTWQLFMMWHTNRAVPVAGIALTTDTVNERRPNPRHFEIRRVLNTSRAYFDAARVAVGVPGWRGLSLDAAYWLSKAIDLGASYTNTAAGEEGGQGRSQSEFDIHQDLKGPSAFDQSHAFLLRLGYNTPHVRRLGSWTFSGVLLAKTGTPFNVLSGSDAPGFGNVDGSGNDRPNLLDPSILGRTIGHPDSSARLLPRSAFGFIRPTDRRGNLGYNVFRKGGIANVNASLSRTWRIRSEKSLTFRAESINFLNTPQFDLPGRELTSPSFGAITNTLNDGRTFRFLLRFSF
jgi:hypothetical protein